ncbi:MAG: hypothetical protein ABIS45_03515 [Burkholderiales bacterium]
MNARNAVLVLLAGLFVFEGCATKTYGRQNPLTEAEKANMSCKDTEVEYQKTLDFMNHVSKGSQPSGADAVAVMIDMGIGNEREKKDAMASAEERLVQLRDVRTAKKCGAGPSK